VTRVNPHDIAAAIDQTLLKPTAGERAAREWIAAQRDAGFASLCVAPAMVPWAAESLAGTPTKVCTVVAFPLGYALSASKADETRRLLEAGAVEIDMVMNVGAALEGDWEAVEDDVRAVVETVRASGVHGSLTKVILETGFLTDEVTALACEACVRAGAEFVKTSTGFGPRGASVTDVRVMRAAVGPAVGVKAAGGIRDLDAALAMLEAGATRIGTSAGLDIVAAAGERARSAGR
jgi:deoxyribose-phosphate aldolase